MQFLMESATLALMGGAIGVLGGVGVAKADDAGCGFSDGGCRCGAILLGLFVAAAVGMFFGVYPASKAAKLDPIVALRAEM